jgi:Cdc6-like AAA superfamily ATPase
MMHNAKLDKVKTRDDLKQFFLEFHNVVNKKLNKPIFSRDECDKLYAKANTVNVVNHFIAVMKSNQIATERTMMHTVTRHLCVDSIAKYMREHGYKYNL